MLSWKIVFFLATVHIFSQAKAYNIVCYYESWSVYYSDKGQFNVEDIDPYMCTHIIFSFVSITNDGGINLDDPWNDEGAIQRLNALRNQNPNLKTMAAIGGASAGSDAFSAVINDSGLRYVFANNIISFLRQYDFNGFDLDWEYPNNKENFADMLRILRPMFDENGYVLSAAVAAGVDTIDSAYDVPALGQYLDFINVMTYDLHGYWDTKCGENSPMYAGPADVSDFEKTLNVHYAIQYWIQKGAPNYKLNLGIGTYGRTFTLQSASNNAVGAPISGAGTPGPYTNGAGMLAYNEICEQHNAGQWEQHWNEPQLSMYAFRGDQWVGFDNVGAVQVKANYIRDNGLAGAMFWAVDTDDFRNTCGEGKFPLINAVKAILS